MVSQLIGWFKKKKNKVEGRAQQLRTGRHGNAEQRKGEMI